MDAGSRFLKSHNHVGVIDYGINNIKIPYKRIELTGTPYKIINSSKNFHQYNSYILPGVGSFDSGIKALEQKDLFNCIQDIDFAKKKIFGICLGMQLLCKKSEEGKKQALE